MYKIIRQALEQIPALTNAEGQVQIYPLGFDCKEIASPLCVYSLKGPEPFRSLSGKLHHYNLVFTADFLAEDFDTLNDLYLDAEHAIVTQVYPGLLSISVTSPEDDAYAAEVDLYRKRIRVDLNWKE